MEWISTFKISRIRLDSTVHHRRNMMKSVFNSGQATPFDSKPYIDELRAKTPKAHDELSAGNFQPHRPTWPPHHQQNQPTNPMSPKIERPLRVPPKPSGLLFTKPSLSIHHVHAQPVPSDALGGTGNLHARKPRSSTPSRPKARSSPDCFVQATVP